MEEKMSQGKSVGAIVRDENDRILVQYRLIRPIGLALPAGHIDVGELPEIAMRRELLEETGLEKVRLKEVFHGTFPGLCGKGHQEHEWWVYEATIWRIHELSSEPLEPSKHKFLKFMSVGEMRPYIEKREYDPSWFEHILPALHVI